MNQRLRRIYFCAFLVIGGGCLTLGCSFQSHPRSVTTVTTSGASVSIGNPPPIGPQSKRPQIDAYVAYFVAKGFPKTDLSAQYYPSGRIKLFHYHASYGNSQVDASIDAPKHSSSFKTIEGLDPATSTTTSTLNTAIYPVK